ncbi:MAG: hypothetical protein P9L95_10735 [Candidatus Tenebribacter mawsonii]|nr:hypothetical protein [Candidatus Tenebribacter mawsonii]
MQWLVMQWVILILSAIFVFWDAKRNNIHEIQGEKSILNISAGGWFCVTLLLWIVAFPLYLINRKKLIEKCKGKGIVKDGVEYKETQPNTIVQDGVKYTRVEKKKSKIRIVLGIIVVVILGLIVLASFSSLSKENLNKMRDYPILYQTQVGPTTTGITFGELLGHPDVKVRKVGSLLYVSLEDIQVTCNLVKIVTENGDVEVIMIGNNQFGNIDVLLKKIAQLNKKKE